MQDGRQLAIRVRWWSVAGFGALGAVLRWGLHGVTDVESPGPVLLANVVGSAVLGWVIGRGGFDGPDGRPDPSLNGDVALGLCGGLTTMSAFTVGVADLLRDGDHLGAGLLVGATVVLGVGAAHAGRAFAERRS